MNEYDEFEDSYITLKISDNLHLRLHTNNTVTIIVNKVIDYRGTDKQFGKHLSFSVNDKGELHLSLETFNKHEKKLISYINYILNKQD